MYNLLFGENSNTEIVLALLGLKKHDVERFRDCSMNEEGISIYSRTGGDNRKDFPNKLLVEHECYLEDSDDEKDRTYAIYYFKFPEDIKEDCLKFLNVKKNGVPAAIIKKVLAVMSRPETAGDKYVRIHTEQKAIYSKLRWNMEIYETNGHTIVPLSDEAMEELLKVAEKKDYPGHEGEFLPYSIKPYKLRFSYEVPLLSFSKYKDSLYRILIDLGNKWEIDEDIWKRYKDKFQEKYPKAIAKIEESLK